MWLNNWRKRIQLKKVKIVDLCLCGTHFNGAYLNRMGSIKIGNLFYAIGCKVAPRSDPMFRSGIFKTEIFVSLHFFLFFSPLISLHPFLSLSLAYN